MSDKLHFSNPTRLNFRLSAALPYLTLLLWLLPLLLLGTEHGSLMAHDEGLYAARARLMFDSGNWVAPWSSAHHKTPGAYWLIAASYSLFGINEFSVRLPSAIAGIGSILLLYEIGKIILNKQIAWLASAILSVAFLWLQYCRLGTPDVPMIFLVLLGILSLLQAELKPKYRYLWGLIAGLSFGLGFLVRSFMIFLSIIGLLPYLIKEHRRHRHLTNPMLYLGFVLGLIPTLVWLWLSMQQYGEQAFEELWRFFFRLGTNERRGNGLIYYFWTVPAVAFPWSILALVGLWRTLRRPIGKYQFLFLGCPLVIFLALTLFATRLPHYTLCLYPFMALLAAVALHWLGEMYHAVDRSKDDAGTRGHGDAVNELSASSIVRNLSYGFGGLGGLLILAGIVGLIVGKPDFHKYAFTAMAVGFGWVILLLVWFGRFRRNYKFLTARYWVASWLLASWLGLAVAGLTGAIGNYNPGMKAFFQQGAIASVVQSQTVHFVDVGGKTGVLLDFYTPIRGQELQDISQLPSNSYAWIAKDKVINTSRKYIIVGTFRSWHLIQMMD
jgi:4-amino-4-deoxy-L-arabinose transferase-like glycosyltransferase